MGHIFTIFLLKFLFICCHSRPPEKPTDLPRVGFTLDGHKFQISILTSPMSDIAEETESETPSTATATRYAIFNVAPQYGSSDSLRKKVQAFYKMKELYADFGNLLKLHENEMLSLLNSQDISEEPKAKDTSIRVRIHNGGSNINNVPEADVPDGHFSVGSHRDISGDNLNIHVHAEPPLRMRTVIGHPGKPRFQENKIAPISSRIRIYPRGMFPSPASLDSPYETTVTESREQDLPNEEETFLRRGSEILLSMWKRFQKKRAKSMPDEQERQNFNEDLVNKDYT